MQYKTNGKLIKSYTMSGFESKVAFNIPSVKLISKLYPQNPRTAYKKKRMGNKK